MKIFFWKDKKGCVISPFYTNEKIAKKCFWQNDSILCSGIVVDKICTWSYQGYSEFESGCGKSLINYESDPSKCEEIKFCQFCGGSIRYENLCDTCEKYKEGDCVDLCMVPPSYWCDDYKQKQD